MKSNRIVSVIFLLISGWFWAESIHVPYKDALFPRLMALLLIVLSLILFTETFLKQRQLVEQKPALTRRNLSIHVPYKDALFPRLMALLLIVLSLILFTETFLKQRQLVEQKPALTRRNLIYM